MNNTDIPEEAEYRITMLISVRPHTIRLYRHNNIEEYRGLEAYTLPTNPVLKKNPLDLSVFLKSRFDYYTSRSSQIIGNKDTWDECYKNLMLLNDAFDGKYKNMIINLCFYNVRLALAIYAKVLSNRFWVQGNRTKEASFSVDSQEYNFNNINVIRAIGCGNSPVFTGNEDSVIPNIFLTTEKEDYSIYCLLVITYFIKKIEDIGTSFEISYGENAEELITVLTEWNKAVGEEQTKRLRIALEYLFEKKVLRKSIDDDDDIATMDTAQSLSEKSKLYISPRGYELMTMLTRDSVYFEMLRECTWREYEGRNDFYSHYASFELLSQKKQNIIFLDLLEYINYIREQEESIFFAPGRNVDLQSYRNAFGTSMVTMSLLTGVEKSLRYSTLINDHTLYVKFLSVQRALRESTQRLQKNMYILALLLLCTLC